MPKCYECIRHNIDTNFNVDQLIAHFKFFHHFASSNNYFCLDCSHTYQSLRAFKRHFKTTNTCQSLSTENIDFLIDSTNSKTYAINPKPDTEQSANNNKLHSIFERIEASTLLFMSNLHSKSNFTRNDVEEIVTDITHLLDKTFSELETYFEQNFDEDLTV